MNRIIKLSFPLSENLTEEVISKIPCSKKETIYNTVDFFMEKIFLKPEFKKINKTKERTVKHIETKNNIQLNSIINLHNEEGIDINKIKSMFKQIKSKQEVLHSCGLPNIRLVKTKNNRYILFDGHHSLLAYMLAGKKHLSEMPHLIVETNTGISDKEIHVFFGKHANKLKNKSWKNYVVNWQASEKKQLCKRKRNNIKELFDLIKKINFS